MELQKKKQSKTVLWCVIHPKRRCMCIYPNKKSHGAVVICPGGGYLGIAMWVEGHKIAAMLNRIGLAAIVLKYRLPNFHANVPMMDTQQSIRVIRANAAKWEIDPLKVGIMGFSAGGNIASFVGTHFKGTGNNYTGVINKIC